MSHLIPISKLINLAYKITTILLDGKRVRLQLWDTSGQGRFCTIIRSYSRGAQGVILVYDITNKWSFDGIDRWLKEVEEVCIHFILIHFHLLNFIFSTSLTKNRKSLRNKQCTYIRFNMFRHVNFK